LAGCAAGLLLGIVLIPALVCGPNKALADYQTYGRVFFGPFLGMNKDKQNGEEILESVNATESIGVRNALHNWMHPDVLTRPADLDTVAQLEYLWLGVTMTFLTLWPRGGTSVRVASAFGGLILLMAIFSPVCHSHYLLFCVPAVMALL